MSRTIAFSAQEPVHSDSTTAEKDSVVAETDTLRSRFIPGIGSLTGAIDSSGMFHRSQTIWSDARLFGDLIWRVPGFFLRELGEAGKPDQLTANGTAGRGIAVLLDGRPLNDPLTGVFHVNDLPLEFVDQVEILTGSEGFLFGHDGTATALNFVTRQFNSLRPITRIRYIQSPSETILTDGLFTQNIARSLNLMVEVQRHVSDGRFQNAALDSWNVRTRLRYNLSERYNMSLTDFYTKNSNGMNGGVDVSQPTPVFDNIAATVRNPNSIETTSRRDVTLSTIARLSNDSSSTTQLHLFYSTIERQYKDGDFSSLQGSSFGGFRFLQPYQFDMVEGLFGIDHQQQKIKEGTFVPARNEFHSSIFARTSLQLLQPFVPNFLARYESFRGRRSISWGANARMLISSGFEVFAGANQSSSSLSSIIVYSTDTSLIKQAGLENERSRLLEAGLRLSADSSFALSISAFRRIVNDATVFQRIGRSSFYPKVNVASISEIKTEGIAGTAMLRFWNFEAYGTLSFTHYQEADTVKTLIPQIVLSGEVAYRDKFFNDALDARFGVRSRFMSRHKGMEFLPLTSTYVENTGAQPGQFSSMDFFAVLRIGDTFVSLTWENLLNINYFITPVYPMPGRNFRLSVNWVFID